MNTNNIFLLFVSFIAIVTVAASCILASAGGNLHSSSNNGHINNDNNKNGDSAFSVVPRPAWVYDNKVSRTAPLTYVTGPPFVGTIDEELPYIIAGMEFSGNTTICLMNVEVNGTCDKYVVKLDGSWTVPRIELVNAVDDAFMFDALDRDTGISATFRWTSYYGLEWFHVRGKIAPKYTYAVDPFTGAFIISEGVKGGETEMIVGAGSVDHHYKPFWNVSIPIPAPYQQDYTSYAQDFIWIAPYDDVPLISFISLGRIFILDSLNGKMDKQLDTPCGYSSTELRMRKIRLSYSESVLVVYGNVENHGFVVCGLAFNKSLDQIFNVEMGYNISLANSDQSVNIIQTYVPTPIWPVSTYNLFVSGSVPSGNGTQTNLWCFDIMNGTVNFILPRTHNDRLNMPLAIDGENHQHVVVTLNRTLQAIDPTTGETTWSCNYTKYGCANTPSAIRMDDKSDTELMRIFCVSAESPQTIIALTVNKALTLCSFAWQENIPNAVDIQVQDQGDLITRVNYPLEPFVTFVTQQGTVWSMSARNDLEPKPTPPPTKAPTPAPSFPPHNIPQSKNVQVRQPPGEFIDLLLTNAAVVGEFNIKQGPVVAAIGDCKIYYEDEKKMEALGVSKEASMSVFYYQSIALGTSMDVYYGFGLLPTAYKFHDPRIVFSGGTNQFVGAFVEKNGAGAVLLLYTDSASKALSGHYTDYPRWGAYNGIAAGFGYTIYTTGVHADGINEYLIGLYQNGDGAPTQIKWNHSLSISNDNKFKIFSSHTSDVVMTSGASPILALSYLNQLEFRSPITGLPLAGTQPVVNPCGYVPANSTIHGYWPMDIYTSQSSSENIIVAVVDTFQQHGTHTWGFCLFDANNNAAQLSNNGFLMTGTAWISEIVPVGTADLFAMYFIAEHDYTPYVGVYEAKTGKQLYNESRYITFGELIVPVSGTDQFITNTDDPKDGDNMLLTVVDAKKGTHLATCDYGCDWFTVTKDSNNVNTIICQVTDFPTIIRAYQYDVTKGTCTAVWETNILFPVAGISTGDISVEDDKFVIVVAENGYTVALSPDAGDVPTPVPPIPTGFNTPTYAQVMNVSHQWQDPIALTAPVVDLSTFSFKYGPIAFGAIEAIPRTGEQDDEDDTSNTVAAGVKKTVLLGYQAQTPIGTEVHDNVAYELNPNDRTHEPVLMGHTQYRNAAAITTTNGDGLLTVISFPTGTYFAKRSGAFSRVASDKQGHVFFSVGAYKNVESVQCWYLDENGATFKSKWTYALHPPTIGNFQVPNYTSHVGDITYVEGSAGQGYITFSFYNNSVTLEASTGTPTNNVPAPCGMIRPLNAANDFAPFPMTPFPITLGNNLQIVANVMFLGDAISRGEVGICGTSPDGTVNTNVNIKLAEMNPPIYVEVVRSYVDILGTDYFVMDIKTGPDGLGVMLGVNAATGKTWTASRTKSTGSIPSTTAFAGQYMVTNWDDPTHSLSLLSLVDATSGQIAVQCSWACANQPVAASVLIEGVYRNVYICSLAEHTNVVRAVYFTQQEGQTDYSCDTYWEYTDLPSTFHTLSLSNAGSSAISVGLSNGGVVTFGLQATAAPITPVPQVTTPTPQHNNNNNGNPGGLSGGVVAAIVILVLLAVVVGIGGVYIIRRRNVRRTALSDATAGMEYGANGDRAADSEGGYGAIA